MQTKGSIISVLTEKGDARLSFLTTLTTTHVWITNWFQEASVINAYARSSQLVSN